jgi:hypothetical protein
LTTGLKKQVSPEAVDQHEVSQDRNVYRKARKRAFLHYFERELYGKKTGKRGGQGSGDDQNGLACPAPVKSFT